MTSREEFEDWYFGTTPKSIFERQSDNYTMLFDAWLAGRQSMRDEAAKCLVNCFGIESRTGYEASDVINEIQP